MYLKVSSYIKNIELLINDTYIVTISRSSDQVEELIEIKNINIDEDIVFAENDLKAIVDGAVNTKKLSEVWLFNINDGAFLLKYTSDDYEQIKCDIYDSNNIRITDPEIIGFLSSYINDFLRESFKSMETSDGEKL